MTGNIRVFAAGGCGSNIGKQLIAEKMVSQSYPGFATIEVAFLDTSDSNLRNVNPELVHLIENRDGSGKMRTTNVDEISRQVRSILQKFSPMDLNIVISSASGGSGSVFAPLVVQELLNEDKLTVVILIGSTDSVIEHQNTVRTIMSMESMSLRTKKPVPVIYFQNETDLSRSAINNEVLKTIAYLAILFSRQNEELDSADLQNFLYYDRVSTLPPRLVGLEINVGTKPITGPGKLVTLVTLSSRNVTQLPTMDEPPAARFSGYLSDEVASSEFIKADPVVSYGVYFGAMKYVVKMLESTLSEKESKLKAVVIDDPLAAAKDVKHDTGLVL